MTTRYIALGPLLSGEGSRAFLGLRIVDDIASPCALVWAPEQVVCEPELVERLRRETAHAERLRHPNIARVFGLIEVEEGLARVVEFADGESLRRILEVVTRLPYQLAVRIVADAALGIQYAHLTGNPDGTPLVHGDLRPETLLVSYSGVTKVTGYGALAVAPKEMGGNRVMGRRTHCAPEQILGGRYAVSPVTDVYSLGSLLYEIITGEIPFEGDKDFERAVVAKEPLLLRSELIPPKLWPVIRKAMAKKANLRFETPQAFSEAVEEAVEGLPSRSELAEFLERTFAADETRRARRRELENGIQEWVVRQGLRLASPAVIKGSQPSTLLGDQSVETAPGMPFSGRSELAKVELISPVTGTPQTGLEYVGSPSQPALPETSPVYYAPVDAERPSSRKPQSLAIVSPTPAVELAVQDERSTEAAPATPLLGRGDSAAEERSSVTTPPSEAIEQPLLVSKRAAQVESFDDTEPMVRHTRKGIPAWAVMGLVVVLSGGAIALWMNWQKQQTPPPAASSVASPPSPAARPAEVPSPGLPTSTHSVSEPETSRNTTDLHPRKTDHTPKPIVASTLEVVTEPPLAVSVDGKAVGTTPVEMPISPGTHRVLLSDSKRGIELIRNFRAKAGPNRLALKVGTGTVIVTAPAGCEVRIDGRLVGTAPLPGPVTVFEGKHRILVSLGKARWQHAFSIANGEKVNADVHLEESKAP